MVTLVNRAKMSTSTTGTGTITLGSAETGYQSFADAGVAGSDTIRYVIEDGDDWEIGTGGMNAANTTMSRTLIESSTGSKLNLTGSAVVFITAAAGDVFQGELFAENYDGTSTLPSATGTNAVALNVQAEATGSYATALGFDAVASGSFSTATGQGSNAGASRSVALGFQATTATGSNAAAIGKSYASGTDSFAAAIANNTSSYGATGANSIAIGYQAKATGTAAYALGRIASAQGDYSISLGNGSTTSSNATFSVSMASSYVDSNNSLGFGSESRTYNGHDYSIVLGRGARSRIKGGVHFGGGQCFSAGQNQTGIYILGSDTTDATAEALTTNNSTPSTDNQVILPNNSAYSFSGTIIAREDATDGSDYASWEIKGALLRDANAASTVLGNGIVNKLYATSGASAWAVALTADTTNGGLKVEVTGAAATNIRWVATVNTSEVTYA